MRMVVPELPQSTASGAARSASTPRPSTVTPEPATVDRHAELRRARGGCGTRRRRRRARRRASAVGHRGEQQRAVRDPLVARDADAAAQRRAADRPGRSCPLDARRAARSCAAVAPRAVWWRRARRERVLERVGPALADDEHQHTAATFERVRDLEVADVHVQRRGQRGDLGDHALAVGHGDAQLEQRLLDGQAHRQVAARGARGLEQVEQLRALTAGDDRRARASSSSR